MTRRRSFVLFVVAGLLFGVAAEPAAHVADWADKNLPVTDGLELWLDARQNATRRALQKLELGHGQPLDVWYDASPHGRHLVQKDAKLQPSYTVLDGKPAIRFDGSQSLGLTGLNGSFKEATIFVVAAPFSNRGDFRAFLAINQADRNDYVSGLTIDQGGGAGQRFQTLNVEGAGFGGAVNLLKNAADFGTVQRLCVTSAVGVGGTRLYVNGKLDGQRDRAESVLRMDQITVGARFYTNGGPPAVRGFLDGDIAEVLVYHRVLSDAERDAVDKYLSAKHGELRKIPLPPRPTTGKPLVSVNDPPPVQMFVPGFTVRQLPVDLTNINNVLYRPDGKLVALAYDGNIYLLSDSDGDGLEDRVELFWDNKGRLRAPIGMALTPPNYKHGQGVFVASKGKCSLIVDTNGSGKADKEIIVADGWQEIAHGVDALGVAVDPKDNSVYFGLGTANYANGYLLDKDGKAHYDLKSERGTILRVAPDFKSREIVCTGIRFPVGLRFNGDGELFCTDQEGATWLPNGNPLDELLYIEKGRHYGFPPRHPKHLPNVIDEPSVFDYGPQRAKDIDAFLERGGGLVYIHYAVDGGADAPGFAQRIGLAWQGGKSKFRHGPLDLGFQGGAKHPIARNFDKVHFHDESYWNLVGDPKKINLLASGKEDDAEQPLFWTLEPSKGRVFVSIPGHYAWTFDDPLFRVLLLRGIAWTAKEPVDRFNDLVTPGARIAD